MCEARVGARAPDFETTAYHRREFGTARLSDQLGRWVILFFYPGDFTFVCTTELPTLAERYDAIREMGAEVLAVSIDSKYVHKVWDEQELTKMVDGGIPYPMLSDAGGAVGRLYGVFDDASAKNIRGTFLIDPDGVLQSMEVLPSPVGRNVDETLRKLRALQHTREKDGREVCPVNWEPGDQILEPAEDLVGQVWKTWKKKL